MATDIYKRFIITEEQKDYLSSKDETMAKLIIGVGDLENYYIPDHFTALLNSVVYQAISFKAATTIWTRFISLVGDVNVKNILSFSSEDMLLCGLSKSKVKYIKNIASVFKNKEIKLDFENMSNAEIIKELKTINGVGNWTAEIFLIFSLYRKDILSYGDLAIRRGIEWLYQLDNKITVCEFAEYENRFKPYNTIASLYLWEITLRKMFSFKSIEDM